MRAINASGSVVAIFLILSLIAPLTFAQPGVLLWKFETGDGVRSSPAIGSDGTVYVGSADNNLYAINGKTGAELWKFETGWMVLSSPAIGSDGTVYVGSLDDNLYAINGKTGAKLWEFETGNDVSSSPAISTDGTVYIGSWDNKLYAINGKTGTKLWEFETGDDVQSSPAIGSDGTVYIGSDDKKLYAINGKTGAKLWEFETGGYVIASPAIGADGTVYVGSADKKLYALNGKTGVKLWEFEMGRGVTSSPVIGADGTVYIGSWDNRLYAINGKTGVKLWEFETGDDVRSSPAIGADGTVYVGSLDGKLYALNGKTGVKLWELKTLRTPFSSPTIGYNGTVYVGSQDKKLYAIITESKGLAVGGWPSFGRNLRRSSSQGGDNLITQNPDLKVLDLSNRKLKSLYGLERFTKLVLLDLRGNKELPSEEVERLRKLLPNCIILYVDETVASEMKGDLRDNFQKSEDSRTILNIIAFELGKSADQVTNQDLMGVKKLDLSNRSITDISCLAGLPRLIALDISGTKITEVPKIKSLRLLTALDNENLTKEQLQWMTVVNPKLQLIHPDEKIVSGSTGDTNSKLIGIVHSFHRGEFFCELPGKSSELSSLALAVGTKCYVICDGNSLVEAEISRGHGLNLGIGFNIKAQNNEPIKKGHEVRLIK